MQGDLFNRPPGKVPLDVVYLFERLSLEVFAAGWEHYSARAVLHRIRWHHHIEKGDRDFKLNNNWTPALARWFMAKHPECGQFFRTRASPAKSNGNPDHDPTDYMGPYD